MGVASDIKRGVEAALGAVGLSGGSGWVVLNGGLTAEQRAELDRYVEQHRDEIQAEIDRKMKRAHL
jgi:hypothetical protein